MMPAGASGPFRHAETGKSLTMFDRAGFRRRHKIANPRGVHIGEAPVVEGEGKCGRKCEGNAAKEMRTGNAEGNAGQAEQIPIY